MATIIDSLVVLLGLDASNYKKGREQAEKETKETARVAKGSADEITKSLAEVGKTIAGLFLGFESATGFAKFLGNVNASEAALGRTAANIGMNVHELNKWGNAVELAGGSAADAQAAFIQLTNDAEKFFVTGEASNLIKTLQQYGISLKDSNGQLRNRGEIFEELANKTAIYGRQYQNFLFKQAGLQQGEIDYLALTRAEREQKLALAERDNAVTEETVRKAQELQMYWRNIGLQIQAAGQMILTAVTPTVEQLLKVFGGVDGAVDGFAAGLKVVGTIAIGIKAIFANIGDWIGANAASVMALLHGDFKGAANILRLHEKAQAERDEKTGADINDLWEGRTSLAQANTVARSGGGAPVSDTGTTTYRNHNPGNLRPYRAGQPVDSRGFRVFGSDAEGRAALDSDIDAKRAEGLNTIAQIIAKYAPPSENDTPAYIAAVAKAVGKGANEQLGRADIGPLIDAIVAHEGAQIRTANRGAAGNTNTTTVQVDKIEVHSATADPRAVAEQVPSAIKRKIAVTQADTGQS